MHKGIWTHSWLILVVLLGLLLSSGLTHAAAATITPFGAQRFRYDHATYVITTKSSYYRKIWQKAIQAWNQTGVFKFEKGSSKNAQIDLDTDSRRQSEAMGDSVGVTQ